MKFAVIGCGSMGNRRIRYIQHLKAGDIVAYDIRSDRRNEVRQKYSIAVVESVKGLIDLKPDALFISVPPAEHMFYINLAVQHGWHFMCEQPITHSLNGVNGLIEKVASKQLITHISCNMRYHQSVVEMKRIIESGTIGPVLTGFVEVGEWLPDWHPYEPYTDYYPSKKSMGGGLDAICDLEWLLDLFGPLSRMACLAGKRSSLKIDTDDVVQILLEFKTGAQISLHTDMLQREFAHKAKFIGEKGTIVCDWKNHAVSLYKADTKKWEDMKSDMDTTRWTSMKMKPGWEWVEPMYLADSESFLARLHRKDYSTDSLHQGIENLKLVLQALDCSSNNMVWKNNN